MSENTDRAKQLLVEFKGDDYIFGVGCFDKIGPLVASQGDRAVVIAGGIGKDWGQAGNERLAASLAGAGVSAGEFVVGAKPNAPREDVIRIAECIRARDPAVIVAIGGGSVIDAAKGAAALATLGDSHPDIEEYFGMGKVSEMLAAENLAMPPIVAVEMAASSAAHLTKYSNITDPATAQKKLIVDDAIVPAKALFDYASTVTMSRSFTSDGALDGIAHSLEVLYGATGDSLEKVRPIALLGIDLIVNHVKRACEAPDDLAAREALGLGTDLGGYSIMIGGTNGAHLTSFSLVDVLSHGRACALMNPYYTVFFSPAIEEQLQEVGAIFAAAGYIKANLSALHRRDLGLAVAEAMIELSTDIGFPTTLEEVAGLTEDHIERALAAAKNPQLEMKLNNMPVALSAETVDAYMGPILEAAKTGDFGRIKNMS